MVQTSPGSRLFNRTLKVLIRGAGEMASGVAVRLFHSHLDVAFTEIESPLCIRRGVSFCEAVINGRMTVEGCTAVLVNGPDEAASVWVQRLMPVMIDRDLACAPILQPDVIVDAILAKKNRGLSINAAELVVALGPGFTAGKDAHVVIETMRGHNLGRLIYEGQAALNTGVPGTIGGQDILRVLRSPAAGTFRSDLEIGSMVEAGQIVADVSGIQIKSNISGTIRGLIRPGTNVEKGFKVGDVDPRGETDYCWSVSDKARAIGGAVLEAIMRHFNR